MLPNHGTVRRRSKAELPADEPTSLELELPARAGARSWSRLIGSSARSSSLRVLLRDLANPRFLLPQLRRELCAEILFLEDLANLHLGTAVERRALQPLDRLFLRLALPDPEAGDQLLRLAERAVGDDPLLAVELHAHALRARVQSL